jgi:hypothetical protein
MVAITAAVLVFLGARESLDHDASSASSTAASIDLSPASGVVNSGGASNPAAVPAPAISREVAAATSTAKSIPTRASTTRPPTATAGTAAAAATVEAPSLPEPEAAHAETTARVVHQHRLGGCRGVLKASAQGLAFEPDSPSKDAFIFAYRDFVHDLDGETLVVKTSDRTFRFQPIKTEGKRDRSELSALLAVLTAAR